MRVLGFLILTEQSPQTGLQSALRSLSNRDGCQIFSWLPMYQEGKVEAMRDLFAEAVEAFRPQFTFLQIQTPGVLQPEMVRKIPGFVINWSGDCRDPLPDWYAEMAGSVDVTAFNNDRDVRALLAAGKRAMFLDLGFSHDVFRPERPADAPSLDFEPPPIVFLGNRYPGRFPRSEHRLDMVHFLEKRYGDRFGVFGSGWRFGTRWLAEAQEAEVYRRARIAINQNHFNDRRFNSDRAFRAMGSGAMCLSETWPGFEADFTAGVHLDTWDTLESLAERIDHYLEHEEERKAIAAAGCAHVHQSHNWNVRLAQVMASEFYWPGKSGRRPQREP